MIGVFLSRSSARKPRFPFAAIALLIALLLAACQSKGNSSSSQTPSGPAIPQNDAVITELKSQNIPFESVSAETGSIKIKMSYNLQPKDSTASKVEADIKAITKVMCKYDKGLNLNVIYADHWGLTLDWHIIQAFCAGQITEDKLVLGGIYSELPADFATPTPTPAP